MTEVDSEDSVRQETPLLTVAEIPAVAFATPQNFALNPTFKM
jgi:hypothetical protein